MKTCPRCHQKTLEDEPVLNCLSRRAEIYICSRCGDEEALIDAGKMSLTETEVKFVEQLQ